MMLMRPAPGNLEGMEKLLLNALLESPALYVPGSEASALVTTCSVWNSDKDKEHPSEALDYGLTIRRDKSYFE